MEGNITQSILSFTPTVEDKGKYLSCRAEHTSIPESGTEDGWKLGIRREYRNHSMAQNHTVPNIKLLCACIRIDKPVVTLELGTNSNTSTIHEGADVYFECNIKSNPWILKVSWRHNVSMFNMINSNRFSVIIIETPVQFDFTLINCVCVNELSLL